jgi:hypothetical protein
MSPAIRPCAPECTIARVEGKRLTYPNPEALL